MTRDEWINRYVVHMMKNGSPMSEDDLIARAEESSEATEQTGRVDPNFWECPEIIADEHLTNEHDE